VNYLTLVQEANYDAQRLETAYQAASRAGDRAAFGKAVHTCYAEAPDNLLYAAWHYRLGEQTSLQEQESTINWRLALLFSIPGALLFWLLSDFDRFQVHGLPVLPLVGGPLSACLILGFLTLASGQQWRRLALVGLSLAIFVIYGVLSVPWPASHTIVENYTILMLLHLSLLAWSGIGLFLLWNSATPDNRFAFLIKSLEAIITGGLFLIGGGVFTAITFALFEALGISIPEVVERLFIAGGAGLVPVLAVALVYRPGVSPMAQVFGQGMSQLIATLMRLLLPLTLLVLAIYLLFIPFYFWGPFRNREVLIVYNAMLFAVMGLLVGATPVREDDLSAEQRLWLRRGLLAVAALAVLVSVYASAAILYRTWQGGLTPNRLTVIGWNLVNITLLLLLLFKQWQTQPERWLLTLRETVSVGTIFYLVWGALVVVSIPLLF
jgi:hypothetical protein